MKRRKKKLKRGFVRGLWGIHDDTHRIKRRRFQTDSDIAKTIKNKYNAPFVVYTYGQENHDHLMRCGFNSILIDKEPFKWDLIKYQYRHKLEILKYAMEEDGYDEMVFIDWDCVPLKKLPTDFWDTFGKKESIQANLTKYRARKCYWREGKGNKQYLPNAGFLYIRDKTIPSKIIKAWEGMESNKQSAEPPIAKMMDDMTGGWQGIDHYWKTFEPETCRLHRKSPYARKDKESCFVHYAGGRTKRAQVETK